MGTGAAYNALIRPITSPAELAAPRIALKRLHAEIEGRRQKEGKPIDYLIRWFRYMGMPAYDEYSPGTFGPELSRTVAVGDSVVTLSTMALFEPNEALIRRRDAFYNPLTVVPPEWRRYAPNARWSAEFPGTPILNERPPGVTVHTLSILPQNIFVVSESEKETGQKGPKEALESYRSALQRDGHVQLSQIADTSAAGVSGLAFSFNNSEAGLAGIIASFMIDSHLLIVETRWQTSATGAKEASGRLELRWPLPGSKRSTTSPAQVGRQANCRLPTLAFNLLWR